MNSWQEPSASPSSPPLAQVPGMLLMQRKGRAVALLSLPHLHLAGATAGCSPRPQGRQNQCSLIFSCPSERKSCRGLTHLPVSPVFCSVGQWG